MLYCFIRENLENALKDENLLIQANYAKLINCFVMLDMQNQCFLNKNGCKIDISNKEIFLRTDYEHYADAMQIIMSCNGILLENFLHREKIKDWIKYYSPKRKIFNLKGKQIFEESMELYKIIKNNETVFLKSAVKGFSSLVKTCDILDKNSKLYEIIEKEKDYLISEKVNITTDEYGKREVRFVVYDNNIINYSRYLHSVSHTVSEGFVYKANEIASHIKQFNQFPKNYIVDLAEFKSNSTTYIDVVEFNPITTALCYINNSIFDENITSLESVKKKYGFGIEFCLDMRANNNEYYSGNVSGIDFSYHVTCNNEYNL